MKTFADVKRRLKVGTILECVANTKRPELNGSRRLLTKVQANALRWTWIGQEAKGPLWTYFPPARMVEVIDADTFRMALDETTPDKTVTLRFVA